MTESTNTQGATGTNKSETPLFVVRRPRFPGIVFLILGGTCIVIGVPGFIVQMLATPSDSDPTFGVMAALGVAFLVIGLALAGDRVNVYDRHYEVKSGFGKLRRREVDDIHTLRYGSQSNGGGPTFISLTAWNDRKKKQFVVFTNYRGYGAFTEWIAARGPEQWAACQGLGVPE
ncbi:hypothetical protein [Curtobacterium flaccumfaciens]|uniref:hypothetical protein n=1 Tax=Curtobacterium flaccumfaciens TaxID=2035 RepID=UPI00265A599E|nr:hypothetical protein [Curtobacterium flaccumfaciens]MCS5507224.1 hypothetical protein [Curtobacterium flaccumfaciens pv. flaccumfaciens]